MNLAAKFVLGSALAASLIFGGYQWREKAKCQDLEDQFVNAISSMKLSGTLRAIGGPNSDLSKSADTMDELDKKKSEILILQLHNECGSTAAETAIRKAGESIAR